MVDLRAIDGLDDAITPLVAEADGEGFRFMRRLQDDWRSGANRFDGRGEFLLGAYDAGRLVAVGGLNVDPYATGDDVGRVRHVYVANAARRSGVGAILLRRIIAEAAPVFAVLRLRTNTAAGAAFYESLGFECTTDAAATHIMRLRAV